MRTFKVLTLIIGMSFLTVACGSERDNPPAPIPMPLQTSTIKTQFQGDTFNYSGRGTWNDGTTTVNISGTATFQILSNTKTSPVTGNDCLDQYAVINISTPAGPTVVSVHTYFHQDENGSIYVDGEDLGSGDKWVTSPPAGYFLSMQSPVSVGQNHGSSATFDDGSSSTISYSVTGIENVSTRIGTFESYRVEVNATIDYANGDKAVESNTEWYVPGLGSIKLQSDATYYSGGAFVLSQKLTFILIGWTVSY
jgi:hypothetical protein